jgi:hypothetical protein
MLYKVTSRYTAKFLAWHYRFGSLFELKRNDWNLRTENKVFCQILRRALNSVKDLNRHTQRAPNMTICLASVGVLRIGWRWFCAQVTCTRWVLYGSIWNKMPKCLVAKCWPFFMPGIKTFGTFFSKYSTYITHIHLYGLMHWCVSPWLDLHTAVVSHINPNIGIKKKAAIYLLLPPVPH